MRGPVFTFVLLAGACSVPQTIADLQDRSPPPAYGRPGWVRTSAGVGAWIGGVLGGAVSVVLLPVTYPLSLAVGDNLGDGSRTDFLFFPATGGAALGHFLIGTPPDMLDYVFRRAWTDPSPMPMFEMVAPDPPLANDATRGNG